MPLNILEDVLNHTPILESVFTFIRSFIFSGSYFHLWYLTALMFALVLVSGIRNVKIRYTLIAVVSLFVVGLIFGSYDFIVPHFVIFETFEKIYSKTVSGFSFGTIYVYLGYIFTQRDIKIKRRYAIFGILVSMILLCFEAILMFKYREISVMGLTIFALPTSVFIFIFARHQEVKIKDNMLLFLRKLSTVLFCIHPIFTSGFAFFNEHFISVPALYTFALVILGSTVSSIIIVKLSERYKLMSYFV